MEIEYIGERLWAGQLGNAFVVFAFTAALLSTIAYFFASKEDNEESSWKKIARVSFSIHSFSVFGVVGLLIFMLSQNMFEYHYIWKHSNSELPARYIFSAFWEGQEGSTILWLFWHSVLGLILYRKAKKWESSVMTVFASVQVMLLTMILGVYFGDYRLGSNPFTELLREHPDFVNLPFLRNPNYLEMLDGRGLNPLLQNYWMTIHPPTLFLGFASTLVPFSFAIAGLWKRDYNRWMKPALSWTFFSIMILGAGILMGGAWAYESLTFGGFWAWDPVENSSLVPWIILVGAGHLMLIQKNKGTSLVVTFGMVLLTFFMILYSSFLTKSGILGESSVHAFADLGLSGQLVFYFGFYGILSIVMLVVRYKDMPKNKGDEHLWSREFWIFLGALILFIAAFQINFTTSIPVWNKLFGLKMASPTDVIGHYNGWQVPLAILIAILVGFTQFLNYRKTEFRPFLSRMLRDLIIALVLTVGIGLGIEMTNGLHLTLLFASLFAVIGNLDYLFFALKAKSIKPGASIAHIGFGMILLGALISNGKKEVISQNSSRYDLKSLDEAYANNENILLMIGDTLKMGDYRVSYKGKEKEGIYVKYNVDYIDANNDVAFTLRPFLQLNERMGNVAEPSTKHYWNKDVFTYLRYAEIEDRKEESEKYKEPEKHSISIGDTIYASNAIIIFDGIRAILDTAAKAGFGLGAPDLLVAADIRVYDFDTKVHTITPYFAAKGLSPISIPAEIEKIGLKLTMDNIDPNSEKMDFSVYEAKNKTKEFIIMSAIVFPYINVLWIGIVVMVIGSSIAVYNRIKMAKS